MAKLPHTAATAMAITILVMNLERRLFLFFCPLHYPIKAIARLGALSSIYWRAAMDNHALA